MFCETALHPFMEVPPGLTVCIREIGGPKEVRSKLCALGLTPGTVVSIFPSSGKDVRKICVRGSSLVLCRTMASCIKCEVLPHDCCQPGRHGAHIAKYGTCCGGRRDQDPQ